MELIRELENIKKELEEYDIKDDIDSSILGAAYDSSYISVADLIGRYDLYNEELKRLFNNLKGELLYKIPLGKNKIKSVMMNIKISDVSKLNEEVYAFELSTETPISTHTTIHIAPRGEIENNDDFGDYIVLNNEKDESMYEIRFICECTNALNLEVAKIFATYVNASSLYNYIIKLNTFSKNLMFRLNGLSELKYKLEIEGGKKFKIVNVKNSSDVLFKAKLDGNIEVDPSSLMYSDPLWYLYNMYVYRENIIYMNLVNRKSDYLKEALKRAYFSKTSTYQLVYLEKEYNNLDTTYYIRNNSGELIKVDCNRVHESENGTITFYFDDNTSMCVPSSDVYMIKDNNSTGKAVRTLFK